MVFRARPVRMFVTITCCSFALWFVSNMSAAVFEKSDNSCWNSLLRQDASISDEHRQELATLLRDHKGDLLIKAMKHISRSQKTTQRLPTQTELLNVTRQWETKAVFEVGALGEMALKEHVKKFEPILNPSEKEILVDLARRFHQTCEDANITYVLYGGSLLGSYRHHDVIPWDDDIDVLVDISQKERLFKILTLLCQHECVSVAGSRFKFYSSKSKKTNQFWWKWPYLDVSFYTENDTHIWDTSPDFAGFIYRKSIIFPIHRRPLSGLQMNAPYDSYATLRDTFVDVSSCRAYRYSHRLERLLSYNDSLVVPCEVLKFGVPFVHREPDPNGIKETLQLGHKALYSLVVDEPKYSLTHPFTLQLLNDTAKITP